MMKRALTVGVVVALLLAFALPAMADEGGDNGDELVVPPGSGLHFAQQIVEITQGGLLREPDNRAGFAATLLARRMAEMRVLAARGQCEHTGYLAQQTEQIMGRVQEALGRAGEPGVDLTEGAAAVAEATAIAEETLDDLLDLIDSGDMPSAAEYGLMRALEAVQNGRNHALSILEDIADGELPGDAARAGQVLRGPFTDEGRPGRGPGNGDE